MVAKQQLSEEYPENPFFKSVLADVYVGLSDEESLRLACHNTTSHFVHKVTHRDIVMSKKNSLSQQHHFTYHKLQNC